MTNDERNSGRNVDADLDGWDKDSAAFAKSLSSLIEPTAGEHAQLGAQASLAADHKNRVMALFDREVELKRGKGGLAAARPHVNALIVRATPNADLKTIVAPLTRLPWYVRRPAAAYAVGATCMALSVVFSVTLAGKRQTGPAPQSERSGINGSAHPNVPPPNREEIASASREPVEGARAGIMPPLRSGHFYAGRVDDAGRAVLTERSAGLLVQKVGTQTLTMVEVPAGTAKLGTPKDETGRTGDEAIHSVQFARGFYISQHEITRELWREVASLPREVIELPPDPARFKVSSDLPVEGVSYEEAVEFCQRLARVTGRQYRLPTEAEWEYAARASTRTPFAFGATLPSAWVNYDCESPYKSTSSRAQPDQRCAKRAMTVAVASLGVANDFGVFDMHGNVWEWVTDSRDPNSDAVPNIARGGGYHSPAVEARSGTRLSVNPGKRADDIGFRVVAPLEAGPSPLIAEHQPHDDLPAPTKPRPKLKAKTMY